MISKRLAALFFILSASAWAGVFAYVPNGNTVSVIDTSSNTVVGSPITFPNPVLAFGNFIAQTSPSPTATPISNTGLLMMVGILAMGSWMFYRKQQLQ